MKPQDFMNLILADEPQIALAISTGAAYEVWFQVELGILLRKANIQFARELPYSAPYASWKLDTSLQDNDGLHAIEIKVESATNSGRALATALHLDAVKIANYTTTNGGNLTRWVVAIGYSGEAKAALQQIAANDPKKMSGYLEGAHKAIGVLLQVVQ